MSNTRSYNDLNMSMLRPIDVHSNSTFAKIIEKHEVALALLMMRMRIFGDTSYVVLVCGLAERNEYSSELPESIGKQHGLLALLMTHMRPLGEMS